ncbi:MAG: sigma-70 family RNA polymerase sigma factor [Anaerolineales bacterium]
METISRQVAEPVSDETLIRQFKNGEPSAFDELYFRHLPHVYKRVRYVVPETDVEDVTQEVFIAALRSLDSFRGEAQFSTWLRTLTNHKVAEFYRKRTRKREPQTEALSNVSGRATGETSGALEERIVLQNALQSLPDRYREVILMRLAEDLQFNEIAEATHQNLEAVKSLFRRALTALRDNLRETP